MVPVTRITSSVDGFSTGSSSSTVKEFSIEMVSVYERDTSVFYTSRGHSTVIGIDLRRVTGGVEEVQ